MNDHSKSVAIELKRLFVCGSYLVFFSLVRETSSYSLKCRDFDYHSKSWSIEHKSDSSYDAKNFIKTAFCTSSGVKSNRFLLGRFFIITASAVRGYFKTKVDTDTILMLVYSELSNAKQHRKKKLKQ